MKTHKYNFLTLSIFTLFPVYALPGILRSMFVGEKFGYALFSIFMGLMAYLMIPYDTMDITRHYTEFNSVASLSFSEVLQKDISRLFLYVFMWIIHNLSLPKETIPLIFVTLSYYLHCLLLLFIINDYKPKQLSIRLQAFIILFSFIIINEIRFIPLASGLRNGLAFSLSLFSVYLLISQKKTILGWVLFSLSVFIHSSAGILLIVFTLSKIKILHKLYRLAFLISLVIILTRSSDYLFYSLMDFLKPYLIAIDAYHPAYFSRDGKWGAGFWTSFNLKTIILEQYIKPLPFYLSAGYLVVVRSSAPEYRRYLYLLFFFVSIVSVSRTLFDRYALFTTLLFITVMMIEYRIKPFTTFKKIFLLVFIISLLVMNVAGLYKYRDIYLISWGKILYTPTPMLLMEKVEPNEYLKRE